MRVEGETSSDVAIAAGGLDAFLSDVRQGQVDRTWVKAMGRDLGFVLFLAPIFDAVASETRAGVKARSATIFGQCDVAGGKQASGLGADRFEQPAVAGRGGPRSSRRRRGGRGRRAGPQPVPASTIRRRARRRRENGF